MARLQTSLTYNESLLEKEKNKVIELEQQLKEVKSTIDLHQNRAEKFEGQARGLNVGVYLSLLFTLNVAFVKAYFII